MGHPSWRCAPGFPLLPVPVRVGQAQSWHCPCFWVLKVPQLILLAFLVCCLCWEGPSLLPEGAEQQPSLSAPGPVQSPSSGLPHGKTFRDMNPLFCSVRRVCNTTKKVQVYWWLVIWPWPGRLYKLQILSEFSFLENCGFVATTVATLLCTHILPV